MLTGNKWFVTLAVASYLPTHHNTSYSQIPLRVGYHVIKWVQGGAKNECYNSDNLRVYWELTGIYLNNFDVCNITPTSDHWMITMWSLLWSLFCLRMSLGWWISLVAEYQKVKKEGVHMKRWCKQKMTIFTIRMNLDNLITNLLQEYQPCISHYHLNSYPLAKWLWQYELLGYWICVFLKICICN